MRIYLGGRISMETSDATVDESDFGGRQPRVVFALLVSEHRRAVPREVLAAALWPERLPRSWEAALRLVVSKVRVALAAAGLPPAEALTNAFGCYQLHLPPDVVIDLELAASAVTAAEAALAVDDVDEAGDQAMVARAIATRPFLPAEASDWAEHIRDGLRGHLLRTLEVLAEVHCRQGDTAAAIESAEGAIALDPFRESAHRGLMRAYAKAGNRGAGLKAYERCRRLLVGELGVGPSEETEEAYLDLLHTSPPREREARTDSRSGDTVLTLPLPEALRAAGSNLLAGREPELAAVRAAWSLVRNGSSQVVCVAGDPGVGKTALAARLACELNGEGATVFYGRCDKERLVPYQPFVEAVNRYVQQCPVERLRDEVGPEGSDLARLVVDLPRRVPELSLPPPAEPETERHRLFGAVAAFLNAVTLTAPVVMVLDDFHWAGSATLVLLRHVVRALESAPLLVIVCYRDDELEADSVLADTIGDLIRERGSHVQLDSLDQKAVAELVSHVLRNSGFDAVSLAGTVLERTAGNPLFVTELLRHLLDSGWTLPTDGTPPLVPTALVDVPRTVHEVIGRRYVRISEGARAVLDVAAVIGQRFRLDLLQLASRSEEERLVDLLDETSRARFTYEVPEAIGCYGFANALSREVVYARLSGGRRAYLHRRVAEAIEQLHRNSSNPPFAELAHHLEVAGQAAKAVGYAVEAGDHAFRCLAYEGAAQHYEGALRLGLDKPEDQQRRCRALMALAAARRKAGHVAAAREAYLEATKLARELGDPEALAGCALGLGGGGRGVSAWIADEVRIGLLEEALAVLGCDDSELRVKVLADLAKALYFSRESERRHALADEAVDVARRLGTPAVLAGALSATRVIRWGPGNTELRLAFGDEVLTLGEQSGDRELIVRARLARLVDLIEIGDRKGVDREIDSVMDLAGGLRQPYYLWRATSWGAHRALMDGRTADAERRIEDALATWHGDPHPDALRCSRTQLATVRVMTGRASEAADLIGSIAETHPMIPSYRCLLAFFLAQADRYVEARAEFERFATDGFVSPPVDANWLIGIAALAETCAFLHDRVRAHVLNELLTPFADRMLVFDAFGGGGSFWGSAAHQLGLLAVTTGRPREAERHLRAALGANLAFGARYCAARTERALRAL